jgi:hypothetical protein
MRSGWRPSGNGGRPNKRSGVRAPRTDRRVLALDKSIGMGAFGDGAVVGDHDHGEPAVLP